MNHSDSFQKHEQNHTIAIFHSSFISFEDLGEFVNVLKYYNFIVVNNIGILLTYLFFFNDKKFSIRLLYYIIVSSL